MANATERSPTWDFRTPVTAELCRHIGEYSKQTTVTSEEGKTLTKTESIKIITGIANMAAQPREPSKTDEMIQSIEDNWEEVMRKTNAR